MPEEISASMGMIICWALLGIIATVLASGLLVYAHEVLHRRYLETLLEYLKVSIDFVSRYRACLTVELPKVTGLNYSIIARNSEIVVLIDDRPLLECKVTCTFHGEWTLIPGRRYLVFIRDRLVLFREVPSDE